MNINFLYINFVDITIFIFVIIQNLQKQKNLFFYITIIEQKVFSTSGS